MTDPISRECELTAQLDNARQEAAALRTELTLSKQNELARFGELQQMAAEVERWRAKSEGQQYVHCALWKEHEALKERASASDADRHDMQREHGEHVMMMLVAQDESRRLRLRLLVKRAEAVSRHLCWTYECRNTEADGPNWQQVLRDRKDQWLRRQERVSHILKEARRALETR